MKKENGKSVVSLIVELICALLGSCVICAALLPAMGHEAGMADCALFIAVDLSIIFLMSRRWWIAPVLIVALGALGAGAVWVFKLKDAVIDYVRGFIEWYSAACPYTLPYSENGSIFLIHLALCFPVTLVLYLFFRRFSFLPVWLLLSGGLLVWMYVTGYEGMLASAAILLIVAFVLIARTNARSINRKLGGIIPAASMQVTALVLTPFMVLFAFAMGPKEDGEWQSKALVNFVEDLEDVMAAYGGGGTGSGAFSLGYSGLAPNGTRLGGDVKPDNKPVMHVKTDMPILLAGTVYDSYDGGSWYDSGALNRFRFNSPLWRGRRREVYDIDRPVSRDAAVLYNNITKEATLEVSMNVRFRAIFAEGKVTGLNLRNGDDADVYFNTQGELFFSELPGFGANYTLTTRVFDKKAPGFDENMSRLLSYAAADEDERYEELAALCTRVPDSVEPFVRELAAEITEGCEDDYQKACAIEKWLADNCTYTQTPGEVPMGRDFVSSFLENREGYCTYYASAMTVLARLAGLPARYATGYGMKQADIQPNTVSYIATNATAHAWTQIYFYGLGWMDFDPVKWNFHELVEKDPPKPDAKPDLSPPPILELPKPELPEPELPELPQNTVSAARRSGNIGKILIIVLVCDAAAFLLFMIMRFVLLFFRVENFYRRLNRKHRDSAARADECYRQILKQLGFLGLEMEPSDTILSFCRRADEALSCEEDGEQIQNVCRPVILSRFANRPPTDEDVRKMCDYYIFMERKLRKTMGIRKYILRRMLFGR